MLTMQYLKNLVGSLLFPQTKQWPTDLLTPEKTRKALERELSRADRTNTELSVVIFHATGGQTLLRLFEVMKTRLRDTDEIGRLSESEICAMLLATSPAGAEKVVAKLLDGLPGGTPHPTFVISTYSNSQPGRREAIAAILQSEVEPTLPRNRAFKDPVQV